ncbi:MAG: glycosyltransferase family 2 protein, partial [Chloroflexi bacterium]|nr:glycosyltransferase family 2 protein [Chloroflexota bacterium]
MPPFVSVIVPVYNDMQGVRILTQALLAQDYPDSAFEVILVDNNSTDGTLDVLRDIRQEHPERIRVAIEDSVRSSYAARNKGIEVARGEILAFTDADCIPKQDWLSAGVRAFDASGARCGGGAITFVLRSYRPNLYEYYDAATRLDQMRYVEQVGFAATANFLAYR